MKTSLKKLTSVFLAVLLVLSIFSVMGAAAADTGNVATGDNTVVLNATFDTSYANWFVWTWTGDNEGHWVGGSGTSSADITFTGVEEKVIFVRMNPSKCDDGQNPNWDAKTDQTDDLTVVNGGTYTLTDWHGGTDGHMSGSWDGGGDENPTGGEGGEGYNPGPGNGPHTVVLNASACDTGYVDWRAWTWAEGSEGYWVGATGTDASDITYVGLEDNVVFAYFTPGSDAGWDGKIGQTDNLTVDGGTFVLSQAQPGDGGVVGSWEGEIPSGSIPVGENTVYLNPGDFAGDGEWYAYTWSSGAGEWKSGTESNGVYEFNDISDNVIFASASGYPEADWGNCAAQTDDLYATNGATYVISDQRPADGDAGEMRPHYIGEWTDPVPVTDPETEPETQEATEEVTQPETQEQINTQPETQPQTEEQVEPGHGLDITTSLNKVTTGTINAKKDAKVTVTFNMQAPMLLEDGQGTLYYDSSKLTLDEFKLPNVTAGLTTNKKIDNEAKFNFMGVDSETESGLTNFKESKVFVTATFTVIAEGSTTVNLDIEELDGFENGSQVAYYTFGKAAPEAASITESLSKPTVVAEGGTQPETQPVTQGQPDTQGQPQTQPVTQGQPTTQAPPVGTKQYKYIPKTEDILSGKNFKISLQDTNGQFHTYDLKPTGEMVDGQPVYAADIPANITPSVIHYQTFQGDTYISQVTKSASEVADGSVVKYDGTIAGQTPVVTQPSSNGGNKTAATVVKKANPVKVKAKKAVKIKASKLKKKAQKVKISKLLKITNAQGTKTFFKVKKGTDKKIYKKLKINKKTGKITLKKGKYKKKTYKIKIKVKVSGKKVGNIQYQAKQVTKVVKIKVK